MEAMVPTGQAGTFQLNSKKAPQCGVFFNKLNNALKLDLSSSPACRFGTLFAAIEMRVEPVRSPSAQLIRDRPAMTVQPVDLRA
jgi:hypothetical protein